MHMQDMIHRASLGNFTAPSMRAGGLFRVEECGDDINNCEEQVRTQTVSHDLINQTSYACLGSAGLTAKTSWMTLTPLTRSRIRCVRAVPLPIQR